VAPPSILLLGRKLRKHHPTFDDDGLEFMNENRNLQNLHLISIMGREKTQKSELLDSLFGQGEGRINIKNSPG